MDNSILKHIRLNDAFLAPRQRIGHDVTIPACLERSDETGRLDAFRLAWKKGDPKQPHVFWDSDVAKVLEVMAQMLIVRPDADMAARLDELVELVVSAQQPDGYLNCHFTVVEPEKRWANIGSWHELYCAGHLIEAAVAHYDATGKRNFLDAMCRYADYIATVFGPNEGQRHGYPGHEELELALVKLYRATGRKRYLDLAKYFILNRGTRPNYFSEVEKTMADERTFQVQAHQPIMEQTEAVGHAVRAVYFFSGAVDVAVETGDRALLEQTKLLFDNIVTRRMYITGGIGVDQQWESFTRDYDLPNERDYAESCAAIGLALFAKRLLDATGEAKYADVIERVVYNNGLSGIGLAGDEYFYANRLTVAPTTFGQSCLAVYRQKWFSCSCCPTNYCRFLPQLGAFCATLTDGEARIDIPAAMSVDMPGYALEVTGGYPYDGRIQVKVTRGGEFTLKVRIPAWCANSAVQVGGGEMQHPAAGTYWSLRKAWREGETVTLTLEMLPQLYYANAQVTMDAGKAALCRGPLVYCVESADNPDMLLHNIMLPAHPEFSLATPEGLPEGTVAIDTTALLGKGTFQEELYSTSQPVFHPAEIRFIPYALWDNRGDGQMQVFLNIMPAARRE